MNKKNILIVFTRNPELGKVKTRLAKDIGAEKALMIYEILLEHTSKVIELLPCEKAIYYSEAIPKNDYWKTSYKKEVQVGADLGSRMCFAFEKSFDQGYAKAVLIGSDLMDLKEEHITKAFDALDESDVVIGPALDGGYYLIGLKNLNLSIFQHKNWGTNSVLNETLADLKNSNITLLESLNDIDTYDDLKMNEKLNSIINNG